MRILFSVPQTSSSPTDFHSIMARGLENRGHEVHCIQFANYPAADTLAIDTEWTVRSVDKFIHDTISARHPWFTSYGRSAHNCQLYWRWRKTTRKYLSDGYDVVVGANICATPATLAGIDTETPSVLITTGNSPLKYNPKKSELDKTPQFNNASLNVKLQYPFVRLLHKWNRIAYRGASEVIAMSEFDASIIKETFAREPRILYIPIPIDEFKSGAGTGSGISLVNPRDPNKGLDTFLQIAERMPEQEFLIAGSLYDDSLESTIEKKNNVTYLGWCDDMSEVYAKTKLLLMPSTYQEGGGRVIIEAYVNGIPAIGSNIGGIPDYIGDGGDVVDNYTDPEAWVTTITQYLSDDEYYQQKSQLARQRSNLFDKDKIVGEFEEILSTIISET